MIVRKLNYSPDQFFKERMLPTAVNLSVSFKYLWIRQGISRILCESPNVLTPLRLWTRCQDWDTAPVDKAVLLTSISIILI